MFVIDFTKNRLHLTEIKRVLGTHKNNLLCYIPKQLMIFIEQNKNIKNGLKMKIVFPDGQEVKYIVPVVKNWEYNDK